MAVGTGAQVVVIDRNSTPATTWTAAGRARDHRLSNRDNIEEQVLSADPVISGVLIPGAAAPKLITRDLLRRMKPGSVVVDVAIDRVAASRPHVPLPMPDPTYVVDDVVHYWSPTCRAACRAPDVCAEQRDAAVRAGICEQGLAPGPA